MTGETFKGRHKLTNFPTRGDLPTPALKWSGSIGFIVSHSGAGAAPVLVVGNPTGTGSGYYYVALTAVT